MADASVACMFSLKAGAVLTPVDPVPSGNFLFDTTNLEVATLVPEATESRWYTVLDVTILNEFRVLLGMMLYSYDVENGRKPLHLFNYGTDFVLGDTLDFSPYLNSGAFPTTILVSAVFSFPLGSYSY